MIKPLSIKRKVGTLNVLKSDGRYTVAVTGGGNLTVDEMAKVREYIGDDPDGAGTLEKLERRVAG